MHHVPGINDFKPILHIIVKSTPNISQMKAARQAAISINYKFNEKYNVIVSLENVDIKADNTTVVNITLDENTNYEEILKYIGDIPDLVKQVEEVDVSNV